MSKKNQGIPVIGPMLNSIFGTRNERFVKRYTNRDDQINALEDETRTLTDEQLRGKILEFRKRVDGGELMEDVLGEAFAVAREAMDRAVGIRNIFNPDRAFAPAVLSERGQELYAEVAGKLADMPDVLPRLLQVNGDNNNDEVIAYLDDFLFDATGFPDPNFNRLVWSDEFATDGPVHSDKWFHQTQLPAGGSWYNGEVQHYTDRIENTEVIDGVLHLTARKETFTDQGVTKQHTSARLNSKFAFTYGRVEVRAKMPFGVGTWPAIWMLGKNINEDGAYWDLEGFGTTPWPACGEMDIMEHWGHNQNYVSSATHTPSSHGNTENVGGQIIPTVSTEFHIYELEWTPERLVFSVDDVVHFVYAPAIKNADTWPFTADEYLLLNVAIQPSIEPSFTSSAMEIDYVRVFQEGDPVSTVELAKGTQLTYFPNPVQDDLTIVLPEAPSQDIKFELYQVDGKLIRSFTQTAASDTLTISGWNELDSGLYLLNFTAGGEEYSVKVVKK